MEDVSQLPPAVRTYMLLAHLTAALQQWPAGGGPHANTGAGSSAKTTSKPTQFQGHTYHD
jgi:hypothetical protein